MSSISFQHEWLGAGGDSAPLRETVAQFTMRVGDVSLTQNQDVWSRTVRDSVLISAYPLAHWFAASWWRLNFEPLPQLGSSPSSDWRMAHEIGAANHGYVWPQVLFASDGEAAQIWAVPSHPNSKQSVRYLAGLAVPRAVPLEEFKSAVADFISGVIERLRAVGQPNTDLSSLWELVLEDQADPLQTKVRKIEAQMGFDPEECPDATIEQALNLENQMGDVALSELAPVYGRQESGLSKIAEVAASDGLTGKSSVKRRSLDSKQAAAPPWQRAVEDARALRKQLGDNAQPINSQTLYGLFGLNEKAVNKWTPSERYQAGLVVPQDEQKLKFVFRKRHPIGKRFEFARFLGNYCSSDADSGQWLASTDLQTFRQKYQRAFAAEFLCPIASLVGFLDGDFSESAIEDAALHYQVSDKTVESLLTNNGYISPRQSDNWFPYRLVA